MIIEEWGNVPQFLDATLYDSEGNAVFCKCGKPAACSVIGKECFQSFCYDCMGSDNDHTLIYKEPSDSTPKIHIDEWFFDGRVKE